MTEIVRPPTSPAAALAAAALPLPAIGRGAHRTPDPREHATPHAQQRAEAAAPSGLRDEVRMLAGHWDALAAALRAAPHMRELVPRPGPDLAALALALIMALKRGAVADWIGSDASRTLPDPLATHLADDFARMGRLNAPEPDQWRFVPVPFFVGGTLEQVLLFTHGRRRRGSVDGNDAGCRILIEFETSRLGKLQLDGLAHGKRFDLIVRSRTDLPNQMRADIAAIFNDGCEIADLTGEIAFKVTRDFIIPQIAATDAPGVTA